MKLLYFLLANLSVSISILLESGRHKEKAGNDGSSVGREKSSLLKRFGSSLHKPHPSSEKQRNNQHVSGEPISSRSECIRPLCVRKIESSDEESVEEVESPTPKKRQTRNKQRAEIEPNLDFPETDSTDEPTGEREPTEEQDETNPSDQFNQVPVRLHKVFCKNCGDDNQGDAETDTEQLNPFPAQQTIDVKPTSSASIQQHEGSPMPRRKGTHSESAKTKEKDKKSKFKLFPRFGKKENQGKQKRTSESQTQSTAPLVDAISFNTEKPSDKMKKVPVQLHRAVCEQCAVHQEQAEHLDNQGPLTEVPHISAGTGFHAIHNSESHETPIPTKRTALQMLSLQAGELKTYKDKKDILIENEKSSAQPASLIDGSDATESTVQSNDQASVQALAQAPHSSDETATEATEDEQVPEQQANLLADSSDANSTDPSTGPSGWLWVGTPSLLTLIVVAVVCCFVVKLLMRLICIGIGLIVILTFFLVWHNKAKDGKTDY